MDGWSAAVGVAGALLGAAVGAAATLLAARATTRGVVAIERERAERDRIGELLRAAIDWDSALLDLQWAEQRETTSLASGSGGVVDADVAAREAGNRLQVVAWRVGDRELRKRAETLLAEGWGFRGSRQDFGKVRGARDALGERAVELSQGSLS